MRTEAIEELRLRRTQINRRVAAPVVASLGAEMVVLYKREVKRRESKLGTITEAWLRVVPELINDHCRLDSFARGTLTVVVDSSSRLYDLDMLMRSSLEAQLLMACRSCGLRRVRLKKG